MSTDLYDIAILGGGPGGYVAALYAGQRGARVALAERDRVGGTCVTVGCIPSKALLDSSHAFRLAADGEVFGVRTDGGRFDMALAVKRKDAVVKQLVSGVETLLKARKVDLIKGEGVVRGPGMIAVRGREGEREVRARALIIATGSSATQPPISGLKEANPLDNEGVLALESVPKRAVIIGGGIVGMEFATFLAEVGSKVTVVEMLPNVLAPYDQELVRILVRGLEKKGVEIVTNAKVNGVAPGMTRRAHEVTAQIGSETKSFPADVVVVATGRRPLTESVEGLKLVTAANRAIQVDDRLRTSVPGVYAIGDCATKPVAPLAHVASMEGEVAVDNILGHDRAMFYGATPEVVYTHPEIAAVGLSEAAAKERHGEAVRVGRFRFAASGRALALGAPEGMVKLVTVGEERRIVGVHIVGPQASELIAEATLAVRVEATAEDLAETIHAHPTLAEALREAALVALGHPIHTAS